MIRSIWLMGVVALAVTGCVSTSELHRGTSERFQSEAEFLAFLDRLEPTGGLPGSHDCDECELIVVTAMRSTTSNPTITNNQTAGVDEGGIIKMIGDHMVILQEGRLFAVDTVPNGAPGIRVTDRINAYRDPGDTDWIDEILVAGNRIIVTAYSYEIGASTFSIFSLDEDGEFSREETYYLASDDYYSSENYASRIIGDRLVFLIPVSLYELKEARENQRPLPWPRIGRMSMRSDNALHAEGEVLVSAVDILKPIDEAPQNELNLVVSCRIGETFSCDSTGVIGDWTREYFVAPDAVYLWTGEGLWAEANAPSGLSNERSCSQAGIFHRAPASQLHRIPLSDAAPSAISVPGFPISHFAMMSDEASFRALVYWEDYACPEVYQDGPLVLLEVELDDLARAYPRYELHHLPVQEFDGWGAIEARFSSTHLAYSRSQHWNDYPPGAGEEFAAAQLVFAPLHDPSAYQMLPLAHSATRMELVGEDILVTGYHTNEGLYASLVATGPDMPHVRQSGLLENRFESEARSHAFNFRREDGSLLMGLPVVRRPESAGRWWWHSESSELALFRFPDEGALTDLGTAKIANEDPHPSYQCEVSCIDWYGNTRPVFINGRVFGLLGTEFVELDVSGDRAVPIGRVDLTAPVSAAASAGSEAGN